jgi:hypothetical protein
MPYWNHQKVYVNPDGGSCEKFKPKIERPLNKTHGNNLFLTVFSQLKLVEPNEEGFNRSP